MQCQVQWIDDRGNPTPDDNEAIGEVWTIERTSIKMGRHMHFPESKRYPICFDHAQLLPGINETWPYWKFEAYSDDCTEV